MEGVSEYLKKIELAQKMLNEVKAGLLNYQQAQEESIARGEQDIAEEKVVVCKTQEELDAYFASL